MRTITIALVCVLIVGMLAGCTTGVSPSPAAVPDDSPAESDATQPAESSDAATEPSAVAHLGDEPIHMTLAIWGTETHQAIYDGIFAEYAAEHPGFTGEVMLIPFAEYSQKITIMMAGGEIPDVVWLSDRMIPQFMSSDQLVNLAPLKDDPEYDFDDINPGSFDLMTKDGDPYGIAFSNPPQIIFYNKTLFDERGVTTPQELYKAGNWNLETFRQCLIDITDREQGIYGMMAGDSSGWLDNTHWLLGTKGVELFPAEGSIGYATEKGKEALKFYMDLIFVDQVATKPGDQVSFDAGKIGLYRGPVSGAKALSTADFEFDIAPLPEGDVPYREAGFAGYFILEDGNEERKAQRIEFLKLLSNKENMFKTSEMFVPSRASIVTSQEYIDFLPIANKEAVQNTIIDSLPDMKVLPGHVNWAKIDAAVRVIFDRLYTQEITTDEAADAFESEVTPLLHE